MVPMSNLRSFSEAGQAVLKFLSKHFEFQSWMITRVSGNDLVVLQIEDNGYHIQQGDVFNWQDTFCFQMVYAGAPKTAASSLDIPLYKHASINQLVNIKSYTGQPILGLYLELFVR